MRDEDLPQLLDGCVLIGAVLGLSPEGVRDMHRKGLIPVTKLGNSYLANRGPLLECRRLGCYWSHPKRRATAEARFAAEKETSNAPECALG